MIVLFTSYLWHCLLAVQQVGEIELQSGGRVHPSQCVWTSSGGKKTKQNTGKPALACLLCVVTQHHLKQWVFSVSLSLVWCCANSLASTIAAASPGCSSSLPVLMRAAGHWGVFVSFFSGRLCNLNLPRACRYYSPARWLKINGNCFRGIIINILLWMPFCHLSPVASPVLFSH